MTTPPRAMLAKNQRSSLRAAILAGLSSAACVASVQNNPDTARHFEHCRDRENGLDERSGWRDREDSEINRLCVAEARERKGLPVEGDQRSAAQRELDALWEVYDNCSDFVPYKTRADVALCEAELSANIDAAKARHTLRGGAAADREQRERHHEAIMEAVRPPEPQTTVARVAPASAGSPDAALSSERRAQATELGRVSPPWWCFEGTIGRLPTGWCSQSAELCSADAQAFGKTEHASVSRGCEKQPLAACVRATKVLQAKAQTDCFASFAGCEALRSHLLGSSDYSGVTSCEGTPTPWVPANATTVSPF